MSEAAERVTATKDHTERACPWCADAIEEDSDIAICTECNAVHHEKCWDDELGCATRKCANAPLPRFDAAQAPKARKKPKPAPAAEPMPSKEEADEEEAPTASAGEDAAPSAAPEAEAPPKKKKKKKRANPFLGAPAKHQTCFQCGSYIDLDAMICNQCLAITSPDGIYHGPKTTLASARNALLLAIFGFFCCGVIAGPIAYTRGSAARAQIARDPRLTGDGLALAAMILGAVDVLGWVLLFFLNLGRLSGKR